MIYKLEDLRSPDWPRKLSRYGLWELARPVEGPLIDRIRAAWAVLTAEADAFTWPGGQ